MKITVKNGNLVFARSTTESLFSHQELLKVGYYMKANGKKLEGNGTEIPTIYVNAYKVYGGKEITFNVKSYKFISSFAVLAFTSVETPAYASPITIILNKNTSGAVTNPAEMTTETAGTITWNGTYTPQTDGWILIGQWQATTPDGGSRIIAKASVVEK